MRDVKKTINKDEISIISQNLCNYRKKNKKNHEIDYINTYKADIYAFQEYPIWGRGKTFYTRFLLEDNSYEGGAKEAEKIWKKYYPWSSFPSAYWSELIIEFDNTDIWIINVHISHYTDQLRLVLLKRLYQLKNKSVIVLGDFNAAFKEQTEEENKGNDMFLSLIRDKSKFVELYDEKESECIPHYTYAHNDSGIGWIKRKLDHVFISDEILKKKENMKWNIELTYIDDVNKNLKYITNQEPVNPLSDHSGMKLILKKYKN